MDIKKINQYEAFHKIGESGLSVIYKAFDSEKQSQVSIKLLKPSDSIKRNIVKIKAYIGLEHPNICTVHAVEEYEDSYIIVSDYIEGVPLQKLLIQSEYDQDNLFDLLQQISSALSFLHKNKLPHGNIKPSNIIITNDWQAILTDLGLSPFEDFQHSPEFVAPYDAYHYLSPEQIKNEPISRQSDIFSVGVITYRILYKKLPFDGQNEDELIKSILEHNPEFAPFESNSQNSIISLLLDKLLAKDPKDRFMNGTELEATLAEIQLLEKNNALDEKKDTPPRNPRKYLIVSIIVVVVAIIWVVSTIIF